MTGHRVLDLNIRPPHVTRGVLDGALSKASVVKLNEAEHALVAELLGADPTPALLARGVEMVALTRGARGAELHTRSESAIHPGFALASPAGDRVGAGDAFSAVLLLGLARGAGLRALLAGANRYAAQVASCPGAMPAVPPDWRRAVERDLGG